MTDIHERIDTSRIYVTYAIEHHPDGIDGDDIDTGTHGGAHDVLITSIMHGETGSSSTAFLGINALGEPMDAEDKFRAWTLLAHELARTLPDGARKEMASMVFESVREAVMRGRDGG